MCEECQARRRTGGMTRRAVLAVAAGSLGALAVTVLSCRQERKSPEKTAETAAASAAAPTPAPDLGEEVFCDASGAAIAKPSDAPVIVIPRSDWTATRPNLNEMQVMNGVNRITVHHTAWLTTTDAWRPTAGELEHIREFHAGTQPNDRGWADIAYHFVVDRAGRVWQARPLAYQGAHVKHHNEHNMGIVLLGDFDEQRPSAAQLVTLSRFIGFVRGLYGIPVAQIFTHEELADIPTHCPGTHLQAYMDRARKRWGRA